MHSLDLGEFEVRKIQVQKAFEAFCGGWLLPVTLGVFGGQKSPQVHFEISGFSFTYYPRRMLVIKHQLRDNIEFCDAKSVLDYVKKMEAMKAQDPNSRGRA